MNNDTHPISPSGPRENSSKKQRHCGGRAIKNIDGPRSKPHVKSQCSKKSELRFDCCLLHDSSNEHSGRLNICFLCISLSKLEIGFGLGNRLFWGRISQTCQLRLQIILAIGLSLGQVLAPSIQISVAAGISDPASHSALSATNTQTPTTPPLSVSSDPLGSRWRANEPSIRLMKPVFFSSIKKPYPLFHFCLANEIIFWHLGSSNSRKRNENIYTMYWFHVSAFRRIRLVWDMKIFREISLRRITTWSVSG